MLGKKKIAALAAEFLGTGILALALLSVTAGFSLSIFTAIAAGLVAGLMVLVVGSASGAHLNPAVTLALWSLRKLTTAQALVYVAVQSLAGFVVWRVGGYLLGGSTERVAAWGVDSRVLAAEVIGAFVFTFGVAAAVYSAYEGYKLASVVGGSLAVGVLVASIASNGIINPAVAIALNSVSWAYIAGPILGGALGMFTYATLFAPAPIKKSRTKK